MPSKRDVLAQLTRDELVSIVDQFELAAIRRKRKDDPVEAIGFSKKATLAEILPTMSRDRLKELCQVFELDDSGRDKATIVESLLGTSKAPVVDDKLEPKVVGKSTYKAPAPQAIEIAPKSGVVENPKSEIREEQ
ncbi:MAG TPA: hypothetical protein VIV60_37565 [Polyangiaceae bacterium]